MGVWEEASSSLNLFCFLSWSCLAISETVVSSPKSKSSDGGGVRFAALCACSGVVGGRGVGGEGGARTFSVDG